MKNREKWAQEVIEILKERGPVMLAADKEGRPRRCIEEIKCHECLFNNREIVEGTTRIRCNSLAVKWLDMPASTAIESYTQEYAPFSDIEEPQKRKTPKKR